MKAQGEPMRIQRALARAGVASRRHVEELVAAGRVMVNGAVATIGQSVNPARDKVTVDGKPVDLAPAAARTATWIVLNKPSGFVTTRSDPEGRRTVFELVQDAPGLTYVGRLDYLTEGLLLLTTDGDAAHRLTHPSAEVERTYVATVRGNAGIAVREAREGIELEDGLVIPTHLDARRLGRAHWEFEIGIVEGRNREVRRVCEALGLEIEKLVRVQFGPVKLGQLPVGKTRPLTQKERDLIEAHAKGGGKLLRAAAEEERPHRARRGQDDRADERRRSRPAQGRREGPRRDQEHPGHRPGSHREKPAPRDGTTRPKRGR